MDYTLNQLKVFLKVVEKQSVTKASEELHLTQPAVSIQLKKFQEEFDIPLTEVIGRQLYVTDFGKEIAASGQKILDEVWAMHHKAAAYKGFLTGQLKISAVSTGKYVMPYFLADFSQKHPGIELSIDVTNKSKVLTQLEQNKIDFALVSVLPEHIQVKRVELMQNKLYMIRKRFKESVEAVYKAGEVPLIYREKGSATRQAMENYVKSYNISSKKSIELTSNEAVKQAVMAGLGYSVMPLIGIKNELLNNSLEIVSIKGLPITTYWNLIWLKEKQLSPIAEAYLQFIGTHKSAVIEEHFNWYEKY
ncbi:LysR family transcriptional regulator [Leptobacterium sp. I13]|uniref:LysR family transcriptional regulator n=1 Tax=Leptobacterium meishanense TaxID=3128904 RepID=UPI0030EDFCFA